MADPRDGRVFSQIQSETSLSEAEGEGWLGPVAIPLHLVVDARTVHPLVF